MAGQPADSLSETEGNPFFLPQRAAIRHTKLQKPTNIIKIVTIFGKTIKRDKIRPI
jgi:hypothetical protein